MPGKLLREVLWFVVFANSLETILQFTSLLVYFVQWSTWNQVTFQISSKSVILD